MKKFALLVATTVLSLAAYAKELSGPAPGFTLRALSGEKVSLSDYQGQVVMINFWASWCGPCVQEMPLLEEMYQDYRKAGFVLLGVNLDEDAADAKGFLAEVPVSFPVLLDANNKVAELYKNQAMPSSYFVDREGNLAYLHRGYRPGEEKQYRKKIMELLAK